MYYQRLSDGRLGAWGRAAPLGDTVCAQVAAGGPADRNPDHARYVPCAASRCAAASTRGRQQPQAPWRCALLRAAREINNCAVPRAGFRPPDQATGVIRRRGCHGTCRTGARQLARARDSANDIGARPTSNQLVDMTRCAQRSTVRC